jgi:hypothetical protein
VTHLARHGITVDLPRGWEASIHWRDPLEGESTHPVLHAGTFPLPRQRGDFGSNAVDQMLSDDVFVVVLEYHQDSSNSALFEHKGVPTSVDAAMFSTSTLQKMLPNHAGTQIFFTEGGRAFCLYIVLGSYKDRERLVRKVNTLLPRIHIEPAA